MGEQPLRWAIEAVPAQTLRAPPTIREPVTLVCDEEIDRGELPTMLLALRVVKTAFEPENSPLPGVRTKLEAVIGYEDVMGACT